MSTSPWIEGELRCLIGPNGAGKSTFFKCLTHQYKASAGRVRFRGSDITGSHTYQIARRGIGIKTQVPERVRRALSVHGEHLGCGPPPSRPARG